MVENEEELRILGVKVWNGVIFLWSSVFEKIEWVFVKGCVNGYFLF